MFDILCARRPGNAESWILQALPLLRLAEIFIQVTVREEHTHVGLVFLAALADKLLIGHTS